MSLTQLKCPNCGGALPDPSNGMVKCLYCDAKFLVSGSSLSSVQDIPEVSSVDSVVASPKPVLETRSSKNPEVSTAAGFVATIIGGFLSYTFLWTAPTIIWIPTTEIIQQKTIILVLSCSRWTVGQVLEIMVTIKEGSIIYPNNQQIVQAVDPPQIVHADYSPWPGGGC